MMVVGAVVVSAWADGMRGFQQISCQHAAQTSHSLRFMCA
jgi:hypothetical protein